jgi:hypothetical protein
MLAGALAGQSATTAAKKESKKYNESEALVGVAGDAIYSAVAATAADSAAATPSTSSS